MPTLQVRNLPDHIYSKLQTNAQIDHRSLSQQALVTIRKGLNVEADPRERRRRLIDRMLSEESSFDTSKLDSPEVLVREDRGR